MIRLPFNHKLYTGRFVLFVCFAFQIFTLYIGDTGAKMIHFFPIEAKEKGGERKMFLFQQERKALFLLTQEVALRAQLKTSVSHLCFTIFFKTKSEQ